ncbi:HK97 family phage prohead protease [Candidatus Woesebacteria bacterium]|nr:HK97 family phage prohead protease [Candidatus Woesebacteria bacterium]
MYETKVAFESDNIRLSMPLMKVDKERRLVHGFATLDNLDKQADIVTKAASVGAFTRFRGNIREQHDPHKAVGRIINFKEDSLHDPDTGKTYSGVFVSAYVSKGAEDTWQKVLDGTLTGFSIGGRITEAEDAFDEDMDKSIRIVHGYELSELSLVDNPANQLANVISIEKFDNGTMHVDTPLVKGGIDNVFWCQNDNIITLKSNEDERCAVCNETMFNVGFVETNDPDKRTTIKTSLESFKKNALTVDTVNNLVKEANSMAEDTIVDETVADEVAKSEDTVEESAPEVEAVVEKAEEAVEVEAETEEVEKSDDAADVEAIADADVVEKDAAAKVNELSDLLASSLSTLVDTVKALNDKVDEMNKSLNGVKGEVTAAKGSVESLGKRVDAVEDTTAFRKSGDLGEIVQEQTIQKSESLWAGRFLTTTDL